MQKELDRLRETDWYPLLEDEFAKDYWICLERCVTQERSCCTNGFDRVHPPAGKVFEALCLTQCAATKAVIVGQDPYHTPGLAHGLAFSVPRSVAKLPPSLRNIHKALREDANLPEEIRNADYSHGNLECWADRGVLLLNTALTVREGAPGSHRHMGWETFTDRVIEEVENMTAPLFMLWGKEAQKKRAGVLMHVPGKRIGESHHPRRPEFIHDRPFSRANKVLGDDFDWRLA